MHAPSPPFQPSKFELSNNLFCPQAIEKGGKKFGFTYFVGLGTNNLKKN